jgi:hypothetical protein
MRSKFCFSRRRGEFAIMSKWSDEETNDPLIADALIEKWTEDDNKIAEIGEVGLPELVGRRRLVPELVGGLDDDEGWAADQAMSLQ